MRFIKTLYSEFIRVLLYSKTLKKNKKFKHSKNNEIYILGSGPSMRGLNILSLKNKDCIFLNNFIANEYFSEVSFSNSSSKYYVIAPIHPPQDEKTWLCWLRELEIKIPKTTTLIFGLNAKKMNVKFIIKKYDLFVGYDLNYFFAGNYSFSFNKSNIDLTKNLIASESVSLYGLYIALFMGYNKIYLLGMDHNYLLFDDTNKMRMFEDAEHQKIEKDNVFSKDNMIEEYLRQYKIFKKYNNLNINYPNKIYNLTKGGLLNVFERKNFEKIC